MSKKTAVIIGAGPAGLTAALEMLRHTGVKPVILEASREIGGLSRTVLYHGNCMDIGGHRFFSKSDRVMEWWQNVMPVVEVADGNNGERSDVMLVRSRRSRIYFLRRFFDYPIQLTAKTLRSMGLWLTLRSGISYILAAIGPKRTEKSLEDFLINRFGRTLYLAFFKSYTEKVWGVPCDQIGAEWGAQRIKGLSLRGVIAHFLKKTFGKTSGDVAQKHTETSLIEKFLYPKFGPGQLWEKVAEYIWDLGGEIHFGVTVNRLEVSGNRVVAVEGVNDALETVRYECDLALSTMPVKDLIRSMAAPVPEEVREVSEGLVYRDFITVGLLVNRLAVSEEDGTPLKDNWIYIQEPDVTVGRLQIFNNWSPALVADPQKVWIGMEYFCNEGDVLWRLSDEEMSTLAAKEVAKIGIIASGAVEDSRVVRVPKAYPAYFGTYDRFDLIRKYIDAFENLFLIGRNGMHRYNNQDHSMLTAMTAVEDIASGRTDKSNIWAINTETEYHEEKKETVIAAEEEKQVA